VSHGISRLLVRKGRKPAVSALDGCDRQYDHACAWPASPAERAARRRL